jgi:signal transduction histidine kinase
VFHAVREGNQGMPDRNVEPSRHTTDSRLRTEREKADDEFAKKVVIADDEAHEVVGTARLRAAEVLRAGREHEDAISRKMSQADQQARSDERDDADHELGEAYVRADEMVGEEGAERARILAALLEYERRDTDEGLLLERSVADDIVKAREEFLGIVSHDLRNELGGISMNIAQIIQRAPDDDAGRRIFRSATNIQRITVRMSRLIGDLLDVASIEAGKLMVVPDDDHIKGIVEGVIESFQPVAGGKGIVLTSDVTAESTALKFDHHRIHQVFGNLLTNALRFTPEGGEVCIRAEHKGGETHLSVSDNGAGIAAARLESIFEKFVQGPRADRKGLGLGLYIAKRIVEAHGGRIWAESALGHGSTFYFTLPDRLAT